MLVLFWAIELDARQEVAISRVGLWRRAASASGLYLEPGVAQSLGEVVVHGAGDGNRVGRRRRFPVVLSEAATEVLLDDGVAGCR